MTVRRLGIILAAAALLLSGACRKNEAVRETAPATAAAAAAASYNAEAVRAENLIKAARVPYVPRYDLTFKKFPKDCSWHAAYGSQNPEVILEAFAFPDAATAKAYAAARKAEMAKIQPPLGYDAVTNGVLALVIHYDPADRAEGKRDVARRFAAAFAAG